jgi:hypothetical protein
VFVRHIRQKGYDMVPAENPNNDEM